jgi:DNA excision repair protein ERCC-4
VTAKNVVNIAAGAENVREVANMGVGELEPLVGREAAGKIVGFFAKDLLEDE